MLKGKIEVYCTSPVCNTTRKFTVYPSMAVAVDFVTILVRITCDYCGRNLGYKVNLITFKEWKDEDKKNRDSD
jgi:hypothetical protein